MTSRQGMDGMRRHSGSTRDARTVAVAVGAIAVLAAVFGALISSGVLGSNGSRTVDDLGQAAAALIASISALVASRRTRGRTRTGWALFATGLAVWCLGQLSWSYIEVILHQPVPAPSIPYVGYLAALPLELAAVLSLTFSPARPLAAARSVIDGLLVAAALMYLSFTLLLQELLSARVSRLDFDVDMALAVGDVAVGAAILLALSRAPRGLRLAFVLLAGGFAAVALSDGYLVYATAAGTYSTGTWPDTGWVAGYLLIALAGAVAIQPTVAQFDGSEHRVQAAVPFITLAVVVGAAIALTLHGPPPIAARVVGLVGVSFAAVSLMMEREDLRQMLRRSQAAEILLERNQLILDELLDTAPVVLFALDTTGRVTFLRGRVPAGLTRSRLEIEGQRIQDLLSGQEAATTMVDNALAGKTGTAAATFDGIQIELLCSPVFDPDGSVQSVSGIALDVTAEHRMQREVAENEAKSRLLATVSHELRTPLNSILGFAQLLEMERAGKLTEKQRRYVGQVQSGGRHLLHLINGILDFSKLAAGGDLEVAVASVPLREAIAAAVEEVRPLAGDRRLEVADGPTPEAVAAADPVRVEQILLNLLANAIQSTDSTGSVVVGCHVAGEWVDVSVTDDGVGIAAADLDRIFGEYMQIEGGRRHMRGGTGLGLPVSRRLAELMNGALTVESRLGHGSTFTLRLPATNGRPTGSPAG